MTETGQLAYVLRRYSGLAQGAERQRLVALGEASTR